MVRVLALLAAASLAACGGDEPTPLDAGVHRAARAPIERRWPARRGPVTLPSGTRLSHCVRNARSDAELQNAGAVLTRAADHLAAQARARRRRRRAAPRLPRRRGAARREAHGRHPRRAAAPHRARGRGARRRRRPHRRARWPRAARRGGDGMKLRLYHHPDGARVAYREAGTGPGARARCTRRCSATASSSRSSSTWPTASASSCPTCRCTATPRTARATRTRWTGSPRCMAAFCAETAGPRPLVGGHGLGAQILLRALELRAARAGPARAHAQPAAPPGAARRRWRTGGARWAPCPASTAR